MKTSSAQLTTANLPTGPAVIRQLPPQSCIYHPEQAITNFCLETRCIMPLCPACIPQHYEMHQKNNEFAHVETLENVAARCFKTVTQVEQNYAQDVQLVAKFRKQKKNVLPDLLAKLAVCKERVTNIVDNYFALLLQDINKYAQLEEGLQDGELQAAEIFLSQKQNEMLQFKDKLNGQKFIKYLVRMLTNDFTAENEHYHRECEQFLQVVQSKLLDVFSDETQLYHLNIELAKFVKVKNGEIYNQASKNPETAELQFVQKNPYRNLQQQPAIKNKTTHSPEKDLKTSAQAITLQGYRTLLASPNKGRVVALPRQQLARLSPDTAKQGRPLSQDASDNKSALYQHIRTNQNLTSRDKAISTTNLRVEARDYFEKRANLKYLLALKDRSNQVAIYNLEKQKYTIEEQQLSITENFTAHNQKILITPIGDIYVSGANSVSKSKNFYKYDTIRNTLNSLPNMEVTDRRGHEFLYLNNSLFAIGGRTGNGVQALDSCERFDFDTNQWKRVASLPATFKRLSSCTFKQKYIFVIGQLADDSLIAYTFDTRLEEWKEAQLLPPSQEGSEEAQAHTDYIPFCDGSAVVEINDNTLLIFGAPPAPNNSFCFVLKLQSYSRSAISFQVQNLSTKAIPADIYVESAVVHQSSVFALVSLRQSQVFKVLRYSGGKWAEYI